MKHITSILALALFSAVLAGCATDGQEQKAAAAPAVSAADAGTEKNVEAALKAEPQLAGSNIDVKAKDGDVTLSGTVKNDWLKYLAETTAKKASGVKSVKNSIKVPE
ncbi:MAG TPA: BON domain-containing protein [Oxalicibacterium sp.]|jgi:hyperosmotically inducible protein|nr:BON domain-containing protein [Oxalicibacterium sp.]